MPKTTKKYMLKQLFTTVLVNSAFRVSVNIFALFTSSLVNNCILLNIIAIFELYLVQIVDWSKPFYYYYEKITGC